ncbi:hypothetical protein ACQZ4O_16135 [Agrobacterium vitis]
MALGMIFCSIVLLFMIAFPVIMLIRTPSDEESLKKRFAADDLKYYAASGAVSERYSAPDVAIENRPSIGSASPDQSDPEPQPTVTGNSFWRTVCVLLVGATASTFVRMGFLTHSFAPMILAAILLIAGACIWIALTNRKKIATSVGDGAISTIAAGVKVKRRIDAIKADVSARIDQKLRD